MSASKTIAIYVTAAVALAFVAGAGKISHKYQDAATCARATVTFSQILTLPIEEVRRLTAIKDEACH